MPFPPAAICFRSSNTKLLPAAIVLATFAIPMALLSGVLLAARLFGETGLTAGGMLAELLVHGLSAFFLWGFIQTVRRMVGPDELRLDGDGLSVTRLGRTVRHPWREVGRPEAVLRSPNSAGRAIRIPLAGAERPWLLVEAEEYRHSVEDMMATIEKARGGVLDGTPPEPSLAAYRYFAIPMAIVTIGVFPALLIYAAYS